MSYIVFTRWTPRDTEVPSAGWVTMSQIQQMANSAEYLREIVGPIPGTDAELQAICTNYLSQYNVAANILSSIGNVSAYARKSTDPHLVITLMQFPLESNFHDAEQAPGWDQYKVSRNAMLDMLSVRMEVKRYESADPAVMEILTSKTPEELSVLFDSIETDDFTTYP